MKTPVLIIGAGPVGLCLALDLASRHIPSIVVETRPADEPPSVKCNHVASRTMETFRRLGFVQRIRAAGLPDDYPNDVVFRTRATGYELTRIPIPCRLDRYTSQEGPDCKWGTPEPAHRINQIYFEPLLKAQAAATPGITLLYQHRYDSQRQDESGVLVSVRDLQSGEMQQIHCDYMVGCDGGRSAVRRSIGAVLAGDEVIQRVQSTYFRAPALRSLIRGKDGWMTYLYGSERQGNLVAIDGRETWLLHNYLLPHEEGFESVDRDRCLRQLLGVDAQFEYQLLTKEDWVGRRLVANKFRDRRVFICGDASHLWVPYAGYGMNAGIADAMNLSWMLAAHLQGWGDAKLLAAHERERHPITEQVSRFAMQHAHGAIRERTTLPADIEDDSAAGAASRARVGEAAYRLNVQQFACAGLNYGYYYDDSPIICADDESPPPYTMQHYQASTVPGCRLPHVWLADGRSLYDALGPWYTLLVRAPSAEVNALLSAADRVGLPLQALDVSRETLPAVYRHDLLLVRPDQHVAWRGNALPADVAGLIDTLRGAV